MDAHQHILGNLLQCDPTDTNAVSAKFGTLLRTYLTPAQAADLLYGRAGFVLEEDFTGLGATLADNPKVLISQAGTPTTAAAISAAAGPTAIVGHRGWVGGSVDNVDAEIDEVALGKAPWMKVSAIPTGQRARCEIGFVIPAAVTARQYFFGWTDDETEGTGTNGSLNVQSALTLVDVADNAVGFIFSSLATTPTVFKYGNTNAGTQATNATQTSLTPVVDQYIILAVELDSAGTAYLYGDINATRGTAPAYIATVTSAVATTSLLVPLFTAAATTTTAVEWEIDYMKATIG
jgi:hypothetical protein